MAISEESRHGMYTRLEAVLGSEHAATLMEHLPPVGWADVATKRDIDALSVATKRDIDAAMDRIRVEFHREIAGHTRALIVGMMANSAVTATLVFAAIQLSNLGQ